MSNELEKAIRDEYQAYYSYRQLEQLTEDPFWKKVIRRI